jgi:hypothetical protein
MPPAIRVRHWLGHGIEQCKQQALAFEQHARS